MQSITSMFADNRLLALAAAIAAFLLFAVLVLLIVRLVFGNRLRMSGGRGRQQRLGVVDAFDLDRQRQLVLVRRDNTEHLVMIGGPNDVLIESTIIRAEMRDRGPPAAREIAASETARLPVPESWASPGPAQAPPQTPAPVAPPTPAPVAPPPLPPVAPAMAPPVPLPSASPVAEPDAIDAPVARPAPPPPAMPPSAAPVQTDMPPAEPSRAAPKVDFFARLRGRGTPPAPPPSPAAEKPPVADADFFETEIAKALAPSVRPRVPGPSLDDPTAPARPTSEGPSPQPETRPSPIPRPPLRPFAPRREPAMAGDGLPAGENAARSAPSRPVPPPFFTKPPLRAKDRPIEPVESRLEPTLPVEETAPTRPLATEAPVHEPAREPHPTPPVSESPPAPVPAAEPVDPFEEEMARLLGRAPNKDG